MARLNSYPNISVPDVNDEIIIDGANGTRNIKMSDLSNEIAGLTKDLVEAVRHRNWWRGHELGSNFTDEQKNAISSGLFQNLYIGDRWYINGVYWRIVDMDYWLNQGDVSCTKRHLVIMPDSQIYDAKMNDENTTEGGYMLSKMRTENLGRAKEIIYEAFGEENILNHREYLCNAVTDGRPSGGAWVDSVVEIPNEIMMYGCNIRAAVNAGNPISKTGTVDKCQLSAMRSRPYLINPSRQYIWLRDTVNGTGDFAIVSNNGFAALNPANANAGVRPIFGLTGGN